MTDLTESDYQDAIDLTHKQKLAFDALIRAVARCKKENVYFHQVLETTYGLNGNNVYTIVGDEDLDHADGAGCLQYLCYPSVMITDGWADDDQFVVLRDDYEPEQDHD